MVIHTGRLDGSKPPREKRTDHGSVPDAEEELRRARVRMKRNGWTETTPVAEPVDLASIEERVVAGDPDALLVFADRLQLAGDPLGEWIALHHPTSRRRSDREAVAERILDLSALVLHQTRGVEVDLRGGLVHRMVVDGASFPLGPRPASKVQPRKRGAMPLLERALRAPAARFVRELVLHDVFDAMYTAVAQAGLPPSLRRLRVVAPNGFGRLRNLPLAHPGLIELTLAGRLDMHCRLGTFDLPALEVFELRATAGAVRPIHLAGLASAELPALKRLVLDLNDVEPEDVSGVLEPIRTLAARHGEVLDVRLPVIQEAVRAVISR